MPWSPLILTVLIGVIYGNRLLDNGFKQFSAPYAANLKNSDAQRAALLEGIITNDNFIYENNKENDLTTKELCQQQSDLIKSYYGNIDCDTDTAMETHKQRGNLIENEEKNNGENTNLNLNSRNPASWLNSKLGHDSSDFSAELVKNGEAKNEVYAAFSEDDPNKMKELRSLLLNSYNINDFYGDLLEDEAKEFDTKRGGVVPPIGCDCKIRNDLLDLGQRHFPRYLLNAVCQSDDNQPRCWRGICKPLEYKVKVLTFRTSKDHAQRDPAMAWLPDDLRQLWKFKTVTVAAGCFCAIG